MKFSRTPPSDPERMVAQDPELKRVLRELAAADAPTSAELRRMSQRLKVVFESPVPRHGLLLRSVRGPAGFVVLGGALLIASLGGLRVVQPRAADVDAAVLEQQSPVQAAPEISAPAPQLEPAQSTQPPPSVTPPRSVGTGPKHHHRTHAAAPVAHAAAGSGETVADAPAPSASVSSSVNLVNPVQPSSATAHEPAPAPTAPAPTAPARPAAPQLDEAALLQRARQLAHSEPDAALRLLSEHQRRFANGMLSPEREVLAIELLRVLARTDEADKRLQSFRQRYPKSVYLKRFER